MRRIYVIRSEKSGTKIGMSVSPDDRLRGVSRSRITGRCSVYFVTTPRPDANIVEAVAHDMLAPRRIKGEWFDVTPEEAAAVVIQAMGKVDADPAYRGSVDNVRQRRQSRRDRDNGIVAVAVRVPVEHADRIRRLAERLRMGKEVYLANGWTYPNPEDGQ